MKWSILALPLLLACAALPACREGDAHATTERIWRTGTMRVGLPPDAAERSYPELLLLERMAAGLGATVTPYPAPIPCLAKALAAGVIDVVVFRPSDTPVPDFSGSGIIRADFTLRGRKVALLLRQGENRFLALCRRHVAQETAAREEPGSAPEEARPAARP